VAAVTPPVSDEYVLKSRLTVWMSSGRVTDQKPRSYRKLAHVRRPVDRALAAQSREHLVRRPLQPQRSFGDQELVELDVVGVAADRGQRPSLRVARALRARADAPWARVARSYWLAGQLESV